MNYLMNILAAKLAALGTDYEKWDQLKNKLDNVPTDLSHGTAIIVEITSLVMNNTVNNRSSSQTAIWENWQNIYA